MNETLDQKIRYRTAVARAHSQVISGQSSTVMVKETPAYSGRAMQILPIVLGNLALTFLTLGIYRFWAKTRMRRYFISRVSFLGDPLEYAGTGMELFKGFLIVLAIMVPLLIVISAVQQFMFPPGSDPVGAALFQIGYMLFFVFLYFAAWYRAQRYRLSRTSWRGIRGGQQGSALLYALYAIGLGLLTLLTLGLAYPVMARVLGGYWINRISIGTETLRFSGGLWKLFVGWMVPWLLFAAYVGLFAFAAWQLDLPTLLEQEPEAIRDRLADAFRGGPNGVSGSIYLALALIVAYLFASLWYSAFETRVLINNTRFDRLELKSRLGMIHILVPLLGYMFVLILAAVAVIGTGFAFHRNLPPETKAAAVPFAPTAIYGGLAALWLVASVVKPLIIHNWLVRNFCRTTMIQGSFSPDTLFQSQLQIPRRGEGLADALDVDAF
jgi:uncharacterized membrane protein YjgN (DUF898 family)